jgi:hypothetical protein
VNSVHDAETSCAVAYSKRVVDKNQWTSRSWVATDNEIMIISNMINMTVYSK